MYKSGVNTFERYQNIMKSSGFIEVDLFKADVNCLDHPEAIKFKGILEEIAEEYHCSLVSFDVDHGTVIFSFDSDELTAKILTILQNDDQSYY